MRTRRIALALVASLVSLLVHDVLDLAQATDRAPWWPLTDRPIGIDLGLIPGNLLGEAAVFGGLLLAFFVLRHATQHWACQGTAILPKSGEGHARWVWFG